MPADARHQCVAPRTNTARQGRYLPVRSPRGDPAADANVARMRAILVAAGAERTPHAALYLKNRAFSSVTHSEP